MSIQLVTYANQTVTPTNDAIIYERAIDQNGIFYGCNVTVSGNEVHITGGYGIVCGREFTIQSEAIAVTLAPSGTLDGRLYVRLDLADADAPIQLLTATGNTLPPLEQDSDVNYTNGTYEMELATFTVGVSALSDVAMTYETIVGSKEWSYTTGTSGNWTWRKYKDGTFNAVYTELNFSTGSLTQIGSSSIYYSGNKTISIPSAIGATSVDSAQMTVAPHTDDTAMTACPYKISTSGATLRLLRFGGSSAVYVDLFCDIKGTWA